MKNLESVIVIKETITKTLEKNYLPYAMSVILSRALPEIDGLKPSHRKLLYTMYKMGLLRGQKTKSANVVGQTMKLNPHGDQAIYATLVRLSRGNESLLYPYVDSKGNFGKVYSREMQYAASRYTEVKLEKICEHIFSDVDKDTVDFEPNYDGTTYEPLLLPVKFPTILVNPNRGIAVGMASNICSFHLGEIVDATIHLMKHPRGSIDKFIMGPDFPTGGFVIRDEEVFKRIIDEGTGTIRIRGISQYLKKENMIEITEIPYTTTVEAIIDKVISLVKDGVIKEINDIRDESDLKGLKIAIDLKRGTDHEKLLRKLYKETTLEDTFSCNFNLLINAYPMQIGVKDILLHWIDFRMGCIRRSIRFDLSRFEEQLHLIQGLKKVLLDIDKAIKIIRETPKESLVVPNLMEEMDLDEPQAEFVANIRLRNINREYIKNRVDEEENLRLKIDDLKKTYDSDERIYAYMKEELLEIKKEYAKERKSRIIDPPQDMGDDEDQVVEIKDLFVVRTREDYIKVMTAQEYEKNLEQRLKQGDEIEQIIPCKSDSEMLLFTNEHNVYKVKLDTFENHRASELGAFVPTLLKMNKGEHVIYMVITSDFKGHMVFAFENGKASKIPLKSYETVQSRKLLQKAYHDGSTLVGIIYIEEPRDLLFTRYHAQKESLALINSDVISEKKTRNSQGVQIIRLPKHARLISMDLVTQTQADKLKDYRALTIPSSGKVRKTLLKI